MAVEISRMPMGMPVIPARWQIIVTTRGNTMSFTPQVIHRCAFFREFRVRVSIRAPRSSSARGVFTLPSWVTVASTGAGSTTLHT